MESLQVARTLIAKHGNDMILSCRSLNQLTYLAQVESLRIYNKPLFSDPIQAWSWGEAEPLVYRAFSKYGLKLIPQSEGRILEDGLLNAVIDRVYKHYGFMTPFDLVGYSSRSGSAWSNTYNPDMVREITIADIKASKDVADYPDRAHSLGESLRAVNARFANTLRLLADA